MIFLDINTVISVIVLLFLLIVLFKLFRILREYERAVIFTLGRYTATRGPGLVVVIPFLQQMVRVDLRVVTLDIPPQDVISRDNVSVQVNAVVYFRVVAPEKAIIQVEHYFEATSQLAQTTLRAVLGKHELDEMLTEREKLNLDVQTILDAQTDGWGIKVTNVEIKHIDLNETMVRAMARQAEAERDRRAKVIHAEGERQAAQALQDAARTLAAEPSAMQLRYLETLTQVAGDKSSTLVFPVPIDLLAGFMGSTRPSPGAPQAPQPPAPAPGGPSPTEMPPTRPSPAPRVPLPPHDPTPGPAVPPAEPAQIPPIDPGPGPATDAPGDPPLQPPR